MSILAIAAMVLSAIACCPMANLVGCGLGLLAMQRIAISNGALRGRRLARSAVIVGLVFSVAGSFAWWKFQTSMQGWIDDATVREVEAFVRACEGGDLAAARGSWVPASTARLSDDALAAFGDQAAARYGSLRSFRIASVVRADSMFVAVYDCAGTFQFEQREAPGSVSVVVQMFARNWLPAARLRRIVIDDAQQGDLTLPPGNPAAETQPRAGPATGPMAGPTTGPTTDPTTGPASR